MNVSRALLPQCLAYCCGFAILAGLVSSTSALAYTKDALNIDVQSGVEEPTGQGRTILPRTGAHGNIFILAPPLEEGSALKLIIPVDPIKVADVVRKVLLRRGYRAAMKGDTPDMTITVLYGRGWVHNPYPSPAVGGWRIRDAAKMGAYVYSSLIVEDKRSNDYQEKLFIIITAWAWDVPAMKMHKAKQLWWTMVYLDDPDHRDLNQVAPQMLAVAADYFDHDTKDSEDEITKPLPEGHVNIGTPQVIEQPVQKGK